MTVARFTENGKSGRTPKWMHAKYKTLIAAGKNSDPDQWDAGLRTQTRQNANVSITSVDTQNRPLIDS
jgi:hypothetical protein